jgi:tRNA (guanine37-N1)-methyltransferase
MATMRIDLVTLFPEACRPLLEASILGRAVAEGHVALTLHDLRQYADDKHRTVDDTPYGGGPGMVLKPEPVVRAIEAVRGDDGHVILMAPQGRPFTQAEARRLAALPHLVLVAGHYEGVDERVRAFVDEEISIGDYVLTGGELPMLVVVDAVVRLLPGVLRPGATEDDSFADGLLEYPQYTRPRVFRGMAVPDVLLSGDHAAIRRWRREMSLRRTWERRPDLLRDARLTAEDRLFLRTWETGRMGKEATDDHE